MAQAHSSGRSLTPNGGQISPGSGSGSSLGYGAGYPFGEGALIVSGAKATLDGASGVFRPPNTDKNKGTFGTSRINGETDALWDKTRSFETSKNSLSHERGSERSERANE